MIPIYFKDKSISVVHFDTKIPDYKIISAGIHDFKYLKGIKATRTHPCYSLHLVLDGVGFFYIYDKKYKLSKNTMFLVPKDIPLKYYPSNDKPWKYVWIDIDASKESVDELFKNMPISIQNPVYELVDSDIHLEKFEEVFNHEDKQLVTLLIYNAFENTLAKLLKSQSSKKPIKDSIAHQAIKIIEQNYQNPMFKIGDIPEKLSISHTYLNVVFKKEMNTTLSSYLIDFRLKKAVDLLKSPYVSIKEAAMLVGYDDDAHFSKAFKSKYNVSATTYRKQRGVI